MPDIVVGTNSYVTLAQAETHYDARLFTEAWTAATDDTKERALIMACTLLDRYIHWNGAKAFEEQSLEWPRIGISWIQPGSIPPSVKVAQMELALVLLTKNTTALSDLAGMAEVKIDSLAIKVAPGDRVQPIPDQIADLVLAYGCRAGGLRSITLTR